MLAFQVVQNPLPGLIPDRRFTIIPVDLFEFLPPSVPHRIYHAVPQVYIYWK